MATTIETTVSLSKTLFDQAESLAQRLNLSQSYLIERAVEQFIRTHQAQETPVSDQAAHDKRQINQGDVFWVAMAESSREETAIPHPYVIVQDNLFNHSRIDTGVACASTSNIRRVSETPGNILLDVDEANLPRQSVVEGSKITTIQKARLGEYVGSLSEQRVDQILRGMRFLQASYFSR